MCSIARAPHYRRAERLLRAVWRVSRVVGGIRADTVSDERPHVDRRGLSEIERSPFRVIGRLCVPSLGRHTIVARNVCYVRCGVSPVSSAASVSYYVQQHVDRQGLAWDGPHSCSTLLVLLLY